MSRKRGGDSSMERFPSASPGRAFPDTSWALVRLCRDGSADEKRGALDRLLVLYWKPVYRFYQRALRLHGEELKDVTQAFFTRFIEKDFLKNLREEKSFRGFLKTACRRFLINWREAERRPRDGKRVLSLDDAAVLDPAAAAGPLEQAIDEEFRAFYVAEALELTRLELARQKKDMHFLVLRARMPEGEREPAYETIAGRLGISLYDVRNYLHEARKVLRRSLWKVAADRSDDPEGELAELGLKGRADPA